MFNSARIQRYFNPRSHEGSDYTPTYLFRISYYFNPRSHEGSDIVPKSVSLFIFISIHAPTRGATYLFETKTTIKINFNPRSHEGSDCSYQRYFWNCYISIHAPTRGATIKLPGCLIIKIFQSTLPRGERLCTTSYCFPSMTFQSTLPRGERHLSTMVKQYLRMISIHAPTRGATNVTFDLSSYVIFQSTLPRGERQ